MHPEKLPLKQEDGGDTACRPAQDHRFLPDFHPQENAQQQGIQDHRRDQNGRLGMHFASQVSQQAPVDPDVHQQVEDRAQRGNPTEVEKRRQQRRRHAGVDQHVGLQMARHAQMPMRDQLHFCEHGQHA